MGQGVAGPLSEVVPATGRDDSAGDKTPPPTVWSEAAAVRQHSGSGVRERRGIAARVRTEVPAIGSDE